MLSWKVEINVALRYLQYRINSYDINMSTAVSIVADDAGGLRVLNTVSW